jgi:hypothetical protein
MYDSLKETVVLFVGVVIFQISSLDLRNPMKEPNGIKQLAKMWVIPVSRAFAERSIIKTSVVERILTKKMLKFVKTKGKSGKYGCKGRSQICMFKTRSNSIEGCSV